MSACAFILWLTPAHTCVHVWWGSPSHPTHTATRVCMRKTYRPQAVCIASLAKVQRPQTTLFVLHPVGAGRRGGIRRLRGWRHCQPRNKEQYANEADGWMTTLCSVCTTVWMVLEITGVGRPQRWLYVLRLMYVLPSDMALVLRNTQHTLTTCAQNTPRLIVRRLYKHGWWSQSRSAGGHDSLFLL